MQLRRLGTSEIFVSPFALGGNVFGWTADRETSFAILDAFVDLGFNLIDTADIYSAWVEGNPGGVSESIIGEWLKASGKRDRIVLASKVGMEMRGVKGLKRAHILKSVEESLTRLQVDTIDLYQAHEDDKDTPLEDTLAAFDELIKAGKVRAIGASNYDATRLREALSASAQQRLNSFVSLQPHYNLYIRERFERDLEPLCLENQVGVLSYCSLAKGFLTGKYRAVDDLRKSPRGGSIERYLDARGLRILKALDEMSQAHHATPATLALAWLMRRKSLTSAIASVTSVDQLMELARSVDVNLNAQEVETLDAASAL